MAPAIEGAEEDDDDAFGSDNDLEVGFSMAAPDQEEADGFDWDLVRAFTKLTHLSQQPAPQKCQPYCHCLHVPQSTWCCLGSDLSFTTWCILSPQL